MYITDRSAKKNSHRVSKFKQRTTRKIELLNKLLEFRVTALSRMKKDRRCERDIHSETKETPQETKRLTPPV
jgi:hypothetical protein